MLRLFLSLLLPASAALSASADEFLKGADLSILKEETDHGVTFRSNGIATDPIVIFKQSGCNIVRLRLFVEPNGKDGQVNTLDYTVSQAKKVKAAGMKFMLDLHYSDRWADTGQQQIPEAWKNLSQRQLVDQMRDYTLHVMHRFDDEDCVPDVVSVGNEITNGMMWPAGGPMKADAKWPDFAELLKAGISGVRQVEPSVRTKVMIHINCGGDKATSQWFFDHCKTQQIDFDLIGVSYYPFWHGDLEHLRENLANLSARYDKDIVVCETAYYMTGAQGKLPFAQTREGQKQFLQALIEIVKQTPRGHGQGVLWWEPAWIDGKRWNGPKWSGDCERRALFDEDGEKRVGIEGFRE